MKRTLAFALIPFLPIFLSADPGTPASLDTLQNTAIAEIQDFKKLDAQYRRDIETQRKAYDLFMSMDDALEKRSVAAADKARLFRETHSPLSASLGAAADVISVECGKSDDAYRPVAKGYLTFLDAEEVSELMTEAEGARAGNPDEARRLAEEGMSAIRDRYDALTRAKTALPDYEDARMNVTDALAAFEKILRKEEN